MKKYFLIFIVTTLLALTSLIAQQKLHWTCSVDHVGWVDSTYQVCDYINNGIMRIPKNLTSGYNYFTRFYLKDTLSLINNFTIETKVKNSPAENGFAFYDIYFLVYGLNNSRMVCALMGENSGLGFTGIDVNGYYILDSPQLIFNCYIWNIFKFQFKNNTLYFYINNNLSITLPYQGDFCYITNLLYSVKGNGSVDWIKIYDENDSLFYFEDFVDCNNLTSPPPCQVPVNPNITITNNSPLCEGDTLYLNASSPDNNVKYNWKGPNGFTSKNKSPVIPNVKNNMSGEYECSIINETNCTSGKNKCTVLIYPKPTVTISSLDTIPCYGDDALISIDNYSSDFQYTWSTGETSKSIIVKDTGDYYVDVIDNNGCKGRSNTIKITVKNIPYVEIENFPDNIVIFDSVKSGNLVYKIIRIKNITTDTIEISNLSLFRNIEFSIPQSQFPIILLPYETKEITIYFAPIRLGEHSDTLYFNNLCVIKIILLGICTANTYSGTSKCNQPLILYTISDSTELGFYPPNPNPLINSTSIYFELNKPISKSEYISENNVRCELINCLGSKFRIDYKVNFIELSNSIRGDITCNFNSDLSDGYYFLICQVIYKNKVIVESFPIVLIK